MAKGKSEALNWLRGHVLHEGDACLVWPYSTSRGYAQVYLSRGELRKAARVMCEWVHGEPPTPDHEAAHSCGNGNKGCVNPKHLSWKTRSENQRDRLRHGTAGNGKTGRGSKLLPQQVQEIIAGGTSVSDFARRFGVTRSAVRKIQIGEIWKYEGQPSKVRLEALRFIQRSARPIRAADLIESGTTRSFKSAWGLLSKLAGTGEIKRIGKGLYIAPEIAQERKDG